MCKKIKIMQVITQLGCGGAENLLYTLCSGILKNRKDIDIKVVVLLDILDLAHKFNECGIEIICLKLTKESLPIRIAKIQKSINKYNPDIVHSHLPNSDRYTLIAAFLSGIKNRVCTLHNIESPHSWQDSTTHLIRQLFATTIIAVSHEAKKYYTQKRRYSSSKLKVIYNCPGFSSEGVKPRKLTIGESGVKIVNIGNLRETKGQLFVIQAISKLKKDNVNCSFVIYGKDDTEYGELCKNEIKRLNLDNVTIAGITDNVQNVLKKSDFVVASSVREAFHMAVAEAMSMGVPIIATDIPPHRELLKGVDKRIFVQPENFKEIANVLKLLIDDSALYYTISNQILAGAQHFTKAETISKHIRLYDFLELKK